MSWERLSAENYRGVRLPRTLGLWLAVAATTGTALVAALGEAGRAAWGAVAGALLVAVAGLMDDLAPTGPRGLRGHLRALASGHMTTGVLKLLVTVASAVIVIALQPSRPVWVRLSGVVLVAGATNVWNGLDVRPGRALKVFLMAGALIPFVRISLLPALVVLWVAAWAALAVDLSERAMLGDAGSNLLGFVAGLALFTGLSDVGVGVAAIVAVALNAVAEIVTFSRVIQATPPLRWVDGLGRAHGDG